MKKFFYSLIITLVVLFGSWFVYNKFLYHIPVEDIPDSYFTYTGDIYTGTREDNGFYRMIDYFSGKEDDQLFSSGLYMIDQVKVGTGDKDYKKFNNLYITSFTWTGRKNDVPSLYDIKNNIQEVLSTGTIFYDLFYQSGLSLGGYDQLIVDLDTMNKLIWQYDSSDFDNYPLKITGAEGMIRSLGSISLLSCYLKDYDRCYNYRSVSDHFSRNIMYAHGPVLQSFRGRAMFSITLELADFLIENDMIDDVMYKKMLADLELGNTYDGDQIFHNMKVSEYNFLKYMIYNTEEGERILGGNLSEILFNSENDNYLTQNKMFFDKDLTHIWLKDIMKNNAENFEKYMLVEYEKILIPNVVILILLDNPNFNHYGIVLLRMLIPRLIGIYTKFNDTISYRDTIIKKYKDYTPTIIREEIRTGAVVDLSGSQNISGVVLENTSLTGTSDVLDIKKDFAYCQQFKNKISVYIKCIKSIE